MYTRVNINFVYTQTQSYYYHVYYYIVYGRRVERTRRHNAPFDLHRCVCGGTSEESIVRLRSSQGYKYNIIITLKDAYIMFILLYIIL